MTTKTKAKTGTKSKATKTTKARNPAGDRARKEARAAIAKNLAALDGKPSAAAERSEARAARFVEVVDAPPSGKRRKASAEPKRMSCLDAAAEVLGDARKARPDGMTAKEIVEQAAARGLWSSPNGKTPEQTLYAAMIREIAAKKAAARFRKLSRGLFAAA